MNAGELLVKLGFEVDTMKLNEFIKDLGELNLSSVIAATGLKGMVDGLTDIIKTADHLGESLNKLTGITGVSGNVFQQWENVAKQANVDAGILSSTIQDIQKHIGQVKFGDPFAIRLQNLFPGLKVLGRENDPGGVLRDELKIMQGMTLEDARDRIIKAGQNEQLLLMIGYQDRIGKQISNTQQDLYKINQYNATIAKLTYDWGIFITAVGAALMPIVEPLLEILDTMLDFIVNLEEAMPQWLKDLSAAAVIWGTIYGIIRAVIVSLGLLSGLSAIKALAPFIAAAIPLLAGAGPWVAGGVAALGFGASMFHELTKPNTDNSKNINGGDVNMNNNYNISGNNADDIAKRIQEHQEALMRDTQGQSRLGWI